MNVLRSSFWTFNNYTITFLRVFLVLVRTNLSRDSLASQFYRLRLADTPSIWWNRAVTGPSVFACSQARLQLLAKKKNEVAKNKSTCNNVNLCTFPLCPRLEKWACNRWRCRWHIELVCCRRPRLWNDCCDPSWAPRMKGLCIYNRAQMMMKRTKAGSLLKA